MTTSGFVIVTKSGRLFRQKPDDRSPPGDISIFRTRANAEATNASTLKGGGKVVALVGPFDGGKALDGYYVS